MLSKIISPVIKKYLYKLEEILTQLLPLDPPAVKKSKVIHDSLWGSRLYYPWEIALMDTPLLQRLRQISQLGTAFLTYPSAVHNRFSHSLGVTILAGRLITRLREKAEIEKNDVDITNRDIYTVRLSGLLHDIGHCFFSHCSEVLMYDFRDECFKEINEKKGFIKKPKPHELISYLIINSNHFKKYWDNFIASNFKEKELPDPYEISQLIVGVKPSKGKRFLQEIISGPYDVDKLEYLYRDACMAGLNISYDIERFFYKIKLSLRPDGNKRLVMEEGGVRAVEQLIFSKMMLFSFVYHHQKILASDSVVIDMIDELLNNGASGGIKIENPLDFLKYTDYDIMSIAVCAPSKRFIRLRDRIKNRKLPKRCFVMNREFIKDLGADEEIGHGWDRLKQDALTSKGRNKIRKKIIKNMTKNHLKKLTIDSVYINIPDLPKLKESVAAPIELSGGKIVGMNEFQQIEGWEKNYDMKKFRGYFFADEDLVQDAADAVDMVLQNDYRLKFDERAKREAKIIF